VSTGRPDALVRVEDLRVHFPVRAGVLRRQVGAVRAVDGVSFFIRPGETLGLVGESGSGKSTTGRAILRLVPVTGGRVVLDGVALTDLHGEELRARRRHMQMIFQDPFASLNPRHTVRQIVREPLDIHRIGPADGRDARADELLETVGLEVSHGDRYPHEFSGGQRQRVGIARALATKPAFIVADEPIAALDVSIQAQIVNLLRELRRELGLTYLFIAHDLSMVRHISDRVAVMYLGRIVEIGTREEIFQRPLHPYTRALIAAIPVAGPAAATQEHEPLSGDIPDPAHPPVGCRFHTRCPLATDLCRKEEPEERDLGGGGEPHLVACHHVEGPPGPVGP
jgi:oligopeptide/dipeptide ABC transporter ATP-binding protein